MTASLSILILVVTNTAPARPESILIQPFMQNKSDSFPTITPAPTAGRVRELRRRQDTTYPTVCGYSNGIESSARIAAPGWVCTTDENDSLWGFCPISSYAANDCALGGACVDTYSCTSGCGLSGNAVSTFTCPNSSPYCTNAYLTVGDTQLFTYLGCGVTAAEDHLLAEFTTTTTTSSSSTISFATSSATSFPSATTSTSSITTSTTSPTASSSAASSSVASSSASGIPQPVASRNYTGAIVGGIIGGLAVICLTALAIFLIKRRRKVFSDNHQESKHTVHEPPQDIKRWNELEGNSTRLRGEAYPSELEASSQRR